jgi:GMP synthase (glutamine-hydrolysing)
LIDNTKNLLDAEMTPKLIHYFRQREIPLTIISDPEELYKIDAGNIVGIILSGGPIMLSEKSDIFFYSKNFTALIEFPQTPILGICFGFQLMGVAYGGLVNSLGEKSKNKIMESVYTNSVQPTSVLFRNMPNKIDVYQCHNDYLQKPPKSFHVSARNENGTIEAIECVEKLRFGVQFHPENSADGHIILDNFIKWSMKRKEPDFIDNVRLSGSCHTEGN